MPYRVIDHTGDIGIEVEGATVAELFAQAAYALFDIMTEAEKIETRLEEKVSVSAADPEALLVTWLSEFLYLFDTKRLLFRAFEINELAETRLQAVAGGEMFDPKRHRIKTEVKAVTYHGLRIEKRGGVYGTTIIFDI